MRESSKSKRLPMYCILGARAPLVEFDFEVGELKWSLRLGALTPTGMAQVREPEPKKACSHKKYRPKVWIIYWQETVGEFN